MIATIEVVHAVFTDSDLFVLVEAEDVVGKFVSQDERLDSVITASSAHLKVAMIPVIQIKAVDSVDRQSLEKV